MLLLRGTSFNYVPVGAVVTIPSISEIKILVQCSTAVQYITVQYSTYKYVLMHTVKPHFYASDLVMRFSQNGPFKNVLEIYLCIL